VVSGSGTVPLIHEEITMTRLNDTHRILLDGSSVKAQALI